MSTIDIHCPICGTALEAPLASAGQAMRCAACRQAFRLPRELFSSPEERAAAVPLDPTWRRVRTGLSLTFYGGVGLFLSVILMVVVLLLLVWVGATEVAAESAGAVRLQIFLGVAVYGLLGVGLLAGIPILIGGFLALAVLPQTGARGPLAGSISCALVAFLFLTGAVVTLSLVSWNQLQRGTPLPEDGLWLPGVFFIMTALLALISLIAYSRFLLRLAITLGHERLAWSASNYMVALILISASGFCGLCLADFFNIVVPKGGWIVRLILVFLASVLFAWWLALVYNLRATITQRLART